MKIIGVINNYDVNGEQPDIFLMADSSLLKEGKPFFLPDFDPEFRMYPSIVIRISRLGKNITKRFATRYYDAFAVGVNIRAEERLKTLRRGNMPWSSAVAFDSSAVMGNFVSLHTIENFKSQKVDVKVNGEKAATWEMENLRLDADSLIEIISRSFTLKIGDFIYLGFPENGFSINIDDNITAESDGLEMLNFKVK